MIRGARSTRRWRTASAATSTRSARSLLGRATVALRRADRARVEPGRRSRASAAATAYDDRRPRVAVGDRSAAGGARRRRSSSSAASPWPRSRRASTTRSPRPRRTSCAQRRATHRAAAGRADAAAASRTRGSPRRSSRGARAGVHACYLHAQRAAGRRRHRARPGGRRDAIAASTAEGGALHVSWRSRTRRRGRRLTRAASTSGACAGRCGSSSSTSRSRRATTSSTTSASPSAAFPPEDVAGHARAVRGAARSDGRRDDLMAADVRGEIAGEPAADE